MAAKGTEAKKIAEEKIKEIFGQDFVGVFDKKLIVNIKESSGEMVQIAITMTCPKTLVGVDSVKVETNESAPSEATTEFTVDEQANVRKLLASLGM